MPNRNSRGGDFSDAQKKAVWEKGRIIPELSPNQYRKDICGHIIQWSSYGVQGKYGWEIDHIKPLSKGGTDDLSNLQPLYWETNREKADQYPWRCGQ